MKYQIIKEKDIYRGRLFRVRNARLSYGGYTFWRETVIHPGAAAIVPVITGHKVILVRQFRYATKREIWEIPAGTLDKNEIPLQCARRELAEETGYSAKVFKKLAMFYPCPGYSSEIIYLYEACNLTKTDGQEQDIDENIKIRLFSRPEIIKLIRRGKIIDAKTIIGLMIWLKK